MSGPANKQGDPKAKAYLEPMQSLGYLSRVNFRMFSRNLEKLTLPHGVSGGQWRFLRVLWEQDNLTQRELSNRAGTKEATTVRAIRGLVKSDFVLRTQSTTDKRKFHITLTPKARRLKTKLMPMVVRVNQQAIGNISQADIDTTRRVLAQTYANLQAQTGEIDD